MKLPRQDADLFFKLMWSLSTGEEVTLKQRRACDS